MTDLSLVLLAALVAGLAATALRLPPLVGFLVAGFVLHGAGVPELPALDTLADLGVALLLFGIGLKLDVRVLVRREVWLTAVLHMSVTAALSLAYLAVLALIGIGLLDGQDWRALLVIGFALSFSSTVLVVTVLEDQSSSRSRFGRTAVGILVIQDVAAVLFLTLAKASPPSPWAMLLILLLPAAWPMRRLLRQLGHDELMPLFGVALALGPGYALFEAVGLKGDLGALVIGLLLADEPRADELSKALFSIKELLLVGFFLSIGFTGVPSSADLLLAGLLLLLIPLKSLGFVALLWWQGMRHRTSVLAGTALANYSEFGLIVIVVGASAGFVSEDWLPVIGIESREERAVRLRKQGLDVIEGDATDPDLWHRLTQAGAVDIAVLAMPFHGSNLTAMAQLEASEFNGTVAAIAQYDDEAAELSERVHSVLGLYDGAGTALADRVAERTGRRRGGEEPETSADA